MRDVGHRFIETNGIKVHIAEQGEGPLVILCHGLPECWYSWRHQLKALAQAGYHAVAPDQRGYGQTDRPEPIEAYNIFQLVGDMVGLVQALGEESAVIVGHDWGSLVAWYSAVLRPDLFRAVGSLSVPFIPRGDLQPSEFFKLMAGEGEFYQLYFQEPGKAEVELEADVHRTMRICLYSASGDAPAGMNWAYRFPKNTRLLDAMVEPERLPVWLSEEDLDFFSAEFERTGFRGGLNYYRNLQRNWELTPFLKGVKVRQPASLIYGDHDVMFAMVPAAYKDINQSVLDLRQHIVLPGCGHWTQQERPEDVNRALIEFLNDL